METMTGYCNAYGMERAIAEGRYRVTENRTGMRVGTSERVRRVVVASGTGRPMKYGDKIFVRLEFPYGYGSGISFCSQALSDMTEVIGEIRRRTRHIRGLCKMCVRNATEGWAIERPLKLYDSGSRFAAAKAQGQAFAEAQGRDKRTDAMALFR